MSNGTLTIYSASAGSGKTHKLTEIFLTGLFRSRYSYRRILAVTFTHKATAEMKSRILENLHKLASNEPSGYLGLLKDRTGKPEEWIRKEAREILNSILHDFSRFSVSTIDSFFQKILRAFTREAGLNSGFSIELDHDLILASAVDEMIASSESDPQLGEWLKRYALDNISEEKSWNLKSEIISLSEELFREKFKILSADQQANLKDKRFLTEYINSLKSISLSFEQQLKKLGSVAEAIFSDSGLSDDMFYQKGKGVPGFIRAIASGTVKEPNSYVLEAVKDPPRWSTGTIAGPLRDAISRGLGKALKDIIDYYAENGTDYRSSVVIQSHIFALGILADVLNKVHQITTSDNTFLLSDAGEVLSLITGSDQSPFIYEKVGNRYETFMIDEFQDTSIIQWKNFKPLIENSMSEGHDNLVVGDVKQAIYRWRNSDWQILGTELNSLIDGERFLSEPLTTNWRSCSNIIAFNNSLFTVIPSLLDKRIDAGALRISFKELYSGAVQKDPGKKKGGYIRLEFIKDEAETDWEEKVLAKLPELIMTVQRKGYRASDIGIIVRDSREGSRVLKALVDFRNALSPELKDEFNFNVVSNDSLLLSNSPAVNMIIAVLSVVNDPGNMISRALMLRTWLISVKPGLAEAVPLVSNRLIESSGQFFPEGYESFLDALIHMPLFEATESIIRFFRLGDDSNNVAYLNTFQDLVLNFAGTRNAGLQSFLDWWDTSGSGKSVVLPANQEAIRILTIHKSKGLEYKIVLLPFLSWNLDHKPLRHPYLWVQPRSEPFNKLGIVPVKYNQELSSTIFKSSYDEEKYSVHLDNVNLLYVAFTRAKDAVFGFSVERKKNDTHISGLLREALAMEVGVDCEGKINLCRYFKPDENIFEYGEIPDNATDKRYNPFSLIAGYPVTMAAGSLRLKLHGENYFSGGKAEVRKKINYGKLMHEVFEGIATSADLPGAVQRLVLEGKLPENESDEIKKKIQSLLEAPRVKEWFSPENEVLTETGIILPSSGTKRPDRVIFRDGKTTVIDFKFGLESERYTRQIEEYRNLLRTMGYENVEAHLWYVDINKIVTV